MELFLISEVLVHILILAFFIHLYWQYINNFKSSFEVQEKRLEKLADRMTMLEEKIDKKKKESKIGKIRKGK